MLETIFSWNTLWWLMLILYVPSCLGLILIVLLQKGKGVGFAGAFGAGPGSEAVFGPRTARSLPQKITYTMAGIFVFFALAMSMISGRVGRGLAPELIQDAAVPAAATTDGATTDPTGAAETTTTTTGDTAVTVDVPEAPSPSGIGGPGTTAAGDTPVDEVVTESGEVTAAPAADAGASVQPTEATDVPVEATPVVEVTPTEAAPADAAPVEAPAAETAPVEEAPAAEAPAAQ